MHDRAVSCSSRGRSSIRLNPSNGKTGRDVRRSSQGRGIVEAKVAKLVPSLAVSAGMRDSPEVRVAANHLSGLQGSEAVEDDILLAGHGRESASQYECDDML